jgi:hypothetical protein
MRTKDPVVASAWPNENTGHASATRATTLISTAVIDLENPAIDVAALEHHAE